VSVQATVRMRLATVLFLRMQQRNQSAIIVQAFWRGIYCYTRYRERRHCARVLQNFIGWRLLSNAKVNNSTYYEDAEMLRVKKHRWELQMDRISYEFCSIQDCYSTLHRRHQKDSPTIKRDLEAKEAEALNNKMKTVQQKRMVCALALLALVKLQGELEEHNEDYPIRRCSICLFFG